MTVDDTLPYEQAAVFVTAADPDQLAELFKAVTGLLLTIRTRTDGIDTEPIEIYLDDIDATGRHHREGVLIWRHINQHHEPIGAPQTTPISQISHIHIW